MQSVYIHIHITIAIQITYIIRANTFVLSRFSHGIRTQQFSREKTIFRVDRPFMVGIPVSCEVLTEDEHDDPRDSGAADRPAPAPVAESQPWSVAEWAVCSS